MIVRLLTRNNGGYEIIAMIGPFHQEKSIEQGAE
jgi:hypothetical protein